MLPNFERQPIRPDKEMAADNEIFFPEWKCFCCHDSGMVATTLVALVITDYNHNRDKSAACQRCPAGGWRTGENYDQRFDPTLCNELAEIEWQQWIDFAKGQQRRIDLTQLNKSLAMPGTRDRTAEDEREIGIRKAEIEAIAPEELLEMADKYLGVETCSEI